MIEPALTLVTFDYPPQQGGVARYLSELVEQADGRIQVVVSQDQPTSSNDSVTSERFFWGLWPRWLPLIGVCRRATKGGRLLLVSHVLPVGLAAWIARRLGGGDYIVLFHGLDLRLIRTAWKRWLLCLICRGAKALLTNSESTRRELISLVPGSVATVLTPAVSEESLPSREDARQQLRLLPDQKVVVSIARLIPRKGLDRALEAMAKLQRTMKATFVIIGDGPDRSRLEEIARREKVTVQWMPTATDTEKNTWLAAADVFLLPVRDEGKDVEGFGIVYLEAAKAGIPSVAGNSGGATEAVLHGQTGLLVDPQSLEALEIAIRRLLEDRGYAKKLGEQGKRRVEADFRWSQRWATLARILGDQS